MWRISKYIYGTWLLGVGLMIVLTGMEILITNPKSVAGIGALLIAVVPFGIAILIFSSPALLFSYAITALLFRFQLPVNERFTYTHIINQIAIWLNLSIFTLLVDNAFPRIEVIILFWPAFAAALLAGLIRYKQFLQLINDLKPVYYEIDLV